MPACDPSRFALLGAQGWHASCQENLQKAMAALGHDDIEIPQPINLFMNIPVGLDASIGFERAQTKAGDSVTLRSELDVVVAVSACPQDMIPINSLEPDRHRAPGQPNAGLRPTPGGPGWASGRWTPCHQCGVCTYRGGYRVELACTLRVSMMAPLQGPFGVHR